MARAGVGAAKTRGALEPRACKPCAARARLECSPRADGEPADPRRLLARQALLALITSLTGGAGGVFAGLLGGLDGARAEGGPVAKGGSFLVGEEGPEIFTPPSSGNIVPAGETAAMLGQGGGQTVVNVPPQEPPTVQVAVVQDRSEIFNALGTPEGERAIIQVVSKNRATLAQT